MNFPESYKKTVRYGEMSKEGEDYKYTETIVHFCKKEAVDKYITHQDNVIAAEQARNSQAVIADAQSEKAWATVE